MLVLPIPARVGSAVAQGEKGDEDEGNLFTSPHTVSTSEGGSSCDGLKLTVKNTFIDVEAERERLDLHLGGAQSCTARIDDGSRNCFSPAAGIPEVDELSWRARRSFEPESTAGSGQDSGATEAEADVLGSGAAFAKAASPAAAPTVPTPTYAHAAPETFEQARVVVKNTFIDIVDDRTPLVLDRNAMSCVARFCEPSAFPVVSPQARPPGAPPLIPAREEGVESLQTPDAAAAVAAALVGGQPPPSLGSELHGQLDDEGKPACQPCAWFHRDTGCMNGEHCKYCHICPPGELKNRKKQKIQRIRAQEAAAAAEVPVP